MSPDRLNVDRSYKMNNLLFLGMPGPMEIFLILLVVLIVFGGRKIPQLARDLGTGIREFRKSVSSASAELEEPEEEKQTNARKKSSRKKS